MKVSVFARTTSRPESRPTATNASAPSSRRNEPRARAARRLPRQSVCDYQARIWATRKHLWVDRVASAWLIRRFIDAQAQFLWLDSPEDCPADALGFDFDGATFTHVGDKVTFEVLLESFGLDSDNALTRLAALVQKPALAPLPAINGSTEATSPYKQVTRDQ